VGSSELIRQRYVPGTALVNSGYPSFDFYTVLAFAGLAVVAAFFGKKLHGRKPATKNRPDKGTKEAAKRKLAELVSEELGKGTPEKEVRSMLVSHGISRKDIDAAFAEAKRKG
jgi:hypothetical protein